MRCPKCGNEPLEVYGEVSRGVYGIIDDEGILKTETKYEELLGLTCGKCWADIPFDLFSEWVG